MSKVEEVNTAKLNNPVIPHDGESGKPGIPEPAKSEIAEPVKAESASAPTVEQVVDSIKNNARGVSFPNGPASEGQDVSGWTPLPINPEVRFQKNMLNTLNSVKKLTGAYKRYPQFEPTQTTLEDTLVKWNFPGLADALKVLENFVVYKFSGGPYDVYVFAGIYDKTLITVHAACRK